MSYIYLAWVGKIVRIEKRRPEELRWISLILKPSRREKGQTDFKINLEKKREKRVSRSNWL